MKNRLIIVFCLALVAIAANAQTTFLERLRTNEAGKGTVTVTQSPEIDKLVDQGTQQMQQQEQRQQAAQQSSTQQPNTTPNINNTPHQNSTPSQEQHQTPKPTPSENNGAKHESTQPTTSDIDDITVDTRKKVMRNSYKTQGYRIQVYSGGNSRADRQRAERAGTVMKASFPNVPVYVHFYSPSWKCRMGNFKTVEEARTYLAQVKKLGYPQACIVKGTISVQY